jgi:hypothetical protein
MSVMKGDFHAPTYLHAPTSHAPTFHAPTCLQDMLKESIKKEASEFIACAQEVVRKINKADAAAGKRKRQQ